MASNNNEIPFGLPLGKTLWTIERFFADPRCHFRIGCEAFPSLEEELKAAFLQLRSRPGVKDVMIHVVDADGASPWADAILIHTTLSCRELVEFMQPYRFDLIVPAGPGFVSQFAPVGPNEDVFAMMWP